jgi:hypothetical protein
MLCVQVVKWLMWRGDSEREGWRVSKRRGGGGRRRRRKEEPSSSPSLAKTSLPPIDAQSIAQHAHTSPHPPAPPPILKKQQPGFRKT